MTAFQPHSEGYWCRTCGVHRTRVFDSDCPVCAPNPNTASWPPPRLSHDRPAPIATSAGEQ